MTYTSQNEAKFSPEATISGKIAYTPLYIQMEKDQNVRPITHAADILRRMRPAFEFVGFITAFIIGFIFMKLFPRRMMRKNEILSGRLIKSIFVGILFLVLTPAVVAVLAITLIGIPLAMAVVLFYLAVIYLAKIWVGLCFGRWLLARAGVGERRGWALLVGLLAYYLVIMVPYIGWVVKIAVLFAGTGVLVIEKIELYKSLSKKRII
ncbi:hypothetical protein M1271_01130 [Patescibacteria group bacterium]|nr:hypothetical protein [Patescibacteria group bacterium]MCL5798409.1 hypothetical protein [Patescibacteria group bacterium]